MVYVPTYNPTVVYGAWPYPAYPPYYYYPPAYVPGAAFFSFSMGVVVGGALWGNCNWGYGDVDIDVNRYNEFQSHRDQPQQKQRRQRATSSNRDNVGNRANNTGKWQHNAEHRQGVGYRDTASQQKYGRGASQQGLQSREEFRGHADQGRQQISREGAANQRDLSGNQIGTRDAGRISVPRSGRRSDSRCGGSQSRRVAIETWAGRRLVTFRDHRVATMADRKAATAVVRRPLPLVRCFQRRGQWSRRPCAEQSRRRVAWRRRRPAALRRLRGDIVRCVHS